jgi:hypothetical protein
VLIFVIKDLDLGLELGTRVEDMRVVIPVLLGITVLARHCIVRCPVCVSLVGSDTPLDAVTERDLCLEEPPIWYDSFPFL